MEEPIKIAGVEDAHVERKAKRKRLKRLCSQIRDQMEFYFSDSNLHKDRFIKQKINASTDGYIDLEIFAKFNRLRQLTTDMDLVAKALSTSALLEVSSDGKNVRRMKPIEEPKDIDSRTVYVEYIPTKADHDWVRRTFSSFGNMSYISLPRYRSTGDMKGFAFVEFETVDSAAKACEAYNNEAISSCRPGRFPRANKQMKLLQRQIEAKRNDGFLRQTSGETEVTPSGKKKQRKRTSSDSSSIGPDLVCEVSCTSRPCKRSRRCSENSAEEVEVTAKKMPPSGDSELKQTSGDRNNKHDEKESAEPEHADVDDISSSKRKEKAIEAKEKVTEVKEKTIEVKEEVTEVKEKQANEVTLAGGDNKVSRELLPETGGLKRKSSRAEAGDVKKVRISEDVQVHSAPHTTKQRRHRQKVKAVTKELPELRVIPKLEWLQLKKEYLELQQRNMHELKETLQQLRAEEQRQIELAVESASKSKTGPKVEYVPGVILKVTSEESMSRKQLKSHIDGVAEVAYIDLVDGNTEGHIRCHDSDNSQKIVALTNNMLNFSLLTGEEEENYWNKLAADREKKLNSKTKHKKRGRNKVSEKAEKVSATSGEKKHTFFGDDDDD